LKTISDIEYWILYFCFTLVFGFSFMSLMYYYIGGYEFLLESVVILFRTSIIMGIAGVIILRK